ncbi:MAG: regulatory protein RecX [Gammaproteobacteria bacterium]
MDEPEADLRAQVRDKALQLLTRREHSFAELRQKLLARDFSAELIEEVLDVLVQRGHLSDRRYAEALASHRAKNGYGPIYISQELREKGVNAGIAEAALSAVEMSWIDIADARHQSHFKGQPPKDYSDWSRRAAYLKRRGFQTEIILKVLGEWSSRG